MRMMIGETEMDVKDVRIDRVFFMRKTSNEKVIPVMALDITFKVERDKSQILMDNRDDDTQRIKFLDIDLTVDGGETQCYSLSRCVVCDGDFAYWEITMTSRDYIITPY